MNSHHPSVKDKLTVKGNGANNHNIPMPDNFNQIFIVLFESQDTFIKEFLSCIMLEWVELTDGGI